MKCFVAQTPQGTVGIRGADPRTALASHAPFDAPNFVTTEDFRQIDEDEFDNIVMDVRFDTLDNDNPGAWIQ